MKAIKVNWDNVEVAFERNSPELHSYIDKETGEVVVAVDGVAEDEETRRMIAENIERYVKIDPASSREQYRWMERFVAAVEEPQLRERLLIAIDGKGAFRRFKDVLLSYPQERERWFNYRAIFLHHHINAWFESKGLNPDPASPWGDVELPPEPEDFESRLQPAGQTPGDVLRLQVKSLVDMLPACELHSARVFLEYLRDRGSVELIASGSKSDAMPASLRPTYEEEDENRAESPRRELDLDDLTSDTVS
jgi:hypothetical protein